MELIEAMRARHSVRKYRNTPIEPQTVALLEQKIAELNAESGLHMKLFCEEPQAFSGKLAHYGSLETCRNYVTIVGEKARDEDVGYFGEKLVLYAQQIGLHTCWVALTYNHKKLDVEIGKGEKMHVIIAIGYGANRGVPHKNKPMETLCAVEGGGEMPAWFRTAVEAAMTAPTAINQQKFHLTLHADGTVTAKALLGPYAKMDLGIVKYHFEIGAGDHPFRWKEGR